MSSSMNPLLRIISDNEQDREEILAWWKESSVQDKIKVLSCIQREYADPVMELMSRFAQLKFAEMVEQERVGKR